MMVEFKNIFEEAKRKTLIAAHRGVAGGNIPGNTLQAFDIALDQGADIIETDVFKSLDGQIFIFHTGQEKAHLGKDLDVTKMISDEIRELRYINLDGNETEIGICSLDECLEHLKGRCFINLDRCWDFWEDVIPIVEHHGMADQILLKSYPHMKYLKKLEVLAPRYMYMPIINEKDECSNILERMQINYIGAELVFASEQSPIMQEDYLYKMKKKGRLLWGNAIVYSYKVLLSAGHNDDLSLEGNPDEGWGWLVDKGFDIIQTDWPNMLNIYLKGANRV